MARQRDGRKTFVLSGSSLILPFTASRFQIDCDNLGPVAPPGKMTAFMHSSISNSKPKARWLSFHVAVLRRCFKLMISGRSGEIVAAGPRSRDPSTRVRHAEISASSVNAEIQKTVRLTTRFSLGNRRYHPIAHSTSPRDADSSTALIT